MFKQFLSKVIWLEDNKEHVCGIEWATIGIL